jgi:PAS domain S-box-containing protein
MLNRTELLKHFTIWAMLICIFFAVFLSVFVSYSQYYMVFFVGAAVFGVNIIILKKKSFVLAGYVFLLTTHGLMLLFDQGIMGPVKGFTFYVPLLLCNLFLVHPKHKLHQFISVSITTGCIILTSFTNVTPQLAASLYDKNHIQIVSYFNVLMSFTVCVVIFYLMNRLSVKTEEAKMATNDLLKQHELLLNSINQNIDVGICRTDALTNRIVYANHAFLNLFGFKSLEELQQINPKELYYVAEDREKILAELTKLHGAASRELLFKRKDGSLFWGLLNSSSLINEQGRMMFDGALRDITSLMKMQQDLVDAKENAEKSSLIKSQFLSSMSHEIRTPMNAVVGACNLLLMEEPKPAQVENLLLLKSAGNNLMRLINNVLDFSRIETGKLEFEEIPTDLSIVLKEITDTHLIEAKRKGVGLQLHMDDDEPAYLVDPMWFSQVLNNLVSNAVKFTEKGMVKVNVQVLSKTATANILLFEVIDTGIGISADKQGLIFKSFSQEMQDTKRKYGGTGLGLAITKNILQKMGSEIKVHSNKGKGATFFFEITLKKAVGAKMPAKSYLPANESLKGLQVLVVEDNPTNLFVIQKFLSRWEVNFTICENGADAINQLKNDAFDAVLMDLHMPDMDGLEATKLIREFDQHTPIIAMTADAFKETRDQAIASGMNDFISKPFDPKDLHDKLGSYYANAIQKR